MEAFIAVVAGLRSAREELGLARDALGEVTIAAAAPEAADAIVGLPEAFRQLSGCAIGAVVPEGAPAGGQVCDDRGTGSASHARPRRSGRCGAGGRASGEQGRQGPRRSREGASQTRKRRVRGQGPRSRRGRRADAARGRGGGAGRSATPVSRNEWGDAYSCPGRKTVERVRSPGSVGLRQRARAAGHAARAGTCRQADRGSGIPPEGLQDHPCGRHKRQDVYHQVHLRAPPGTRVQDGGLHIPAPHQLGRTADGRLGPGHRRGVLPADVPHQTGCGRSGARSGAGRIAYPVRGADCCRLPLFQRAGL